MQKMTVAASGCGYASGEGQRLAKNISGHKSRLGRMLPRGGIFRSFSSRPWHGVCNMFGLLAAGENAGRDEASGRKLVDN
jgi:hypothetical protein